MESDMNVGTPSTSEKKGGIVRQRTSPDQIENTKNPRLDLTGASMADVNEVDSHSESSNDSDMESATEEATEEIDDGELPNDIPSLAKFMLKRFDRSDKRLDAKIKAIKVVTSTNRTEIKKVDTRVDQLTQEVRDLQLTVKSLCDDNASLKVRLIGNETRSMKDSLLIDGVVEEDKETPTECEQKVRNVVDNHTDLELGDMSLQRCIRVGPKPKQGQQNARPRSIAVKFAWQRERDELWRKRFAFQKTEFFVNEQFPREIARRRRELYPILKLIKSIDKYAKISTIAGDRLIVDGVGYTSETLHNLPGDIDISRLYTQSANGVTYFFRKRSPLSNHHPANFHIGEHNYNCSEQYYFARMATLCGDGNALATIMNTDDPVQMKGAAYKIRKESKQWKSAKLSTMKEGVLAKFGQNPKLRDYLLATGTNRLAECNPGDKYWSIGKSINAKDRGDQLSWDQNHLGIILEEVRSQLI
jgi:hypothetical protein